MPESGLTLPPRKFGIVLALFIGAVFGAGFPALGAWSWNPWVPMIAAIIAVVALAYPPAITPLQRGWMWVGGGLAWFNTRLLLGFVFFGIIWPLSILRRIGGASDIDKGPDPARRSYRVPVSRDHRTDFDRPY